jgi:hypothetical protein
MDKDYILYLATKKLETTMIGSLARFEDAFGNLWGHNKNYDQPLTEREIEYENIWTDTRNRILDHGNKQIRAMVNDLKKVLNDKLQTKYTYKFHVNNPQENQE